MTPKTTQTHSLSCALITRAIWLFLLLTPPAMAHFQELIPSHPVQTPRDGRDLSLQLTFTHPMAQGPVMAMPDPVRAGVLIGQNSPIDLRSALVATTRQGQRSYDLPFRIQQPGDHLFFLEPGLYWEPSEQKWIRHYTKVIVDAFSGEENWERLVGFPVEISPLVRPYGLWTGNQFRGTVLRNNQPLPYARLEVEWRNDGSVTAPAPAYTTHVIKADAQGVFSYTMPRSGWWGFAALTEAQTRLPAPDGTPAPIEDGAVIWIHVQDMH